MFDLIDARAYVPPGLVLANNNIKFSSSSQVVRKTGEEVARQGKLRALNVSYNVSTGLLDLRGSLHKYHDDGRNSGDFSRSDVIAAVEQLSEELQLRPDQLRLHALEFGVNIIPPANTKQIIDRLHLYRSGKLQHFQPMRLKNKGYGKDTQVGQAHYWIKGYDKGTQEHLLENLLRLEYHARGSHLCGKLKCTDLTLAILTKPDFINGCAGLLRDAITTGIVWNEPVAEDRMQPSELSSYLHYTAVHYWDTVKGKPRARQLDNYRALAHNYRTDNHTSTTITAALQKLEALTATTVYLPTLPCATVPLPSLTNYAQSFAELLAPHLTDFSQLTVAECHRLAAGRCVVCNRLLSKDRYPGTQTCPRSVRQCRNVKSNRYHDRLKPLRRDHKLARAGQGRLFDLTTGLVMPAVAP